LGCRQKERGVTKEVRSGEIGFSGPVRKNNFTAQQGSLPAGAWGDEGSAKRENWFFGHRPEK